MTTEFAIADANAREAALDTTRSFIVQAPAGSGKTELLTQRYLRLLSLVTHPEEIHAITFTRKAAAEMRYRIVAALDAANGPQPQEPHKRLTWKLATAAMRRDAERGWQLGHNPNRLRIQTFDSLSHALARQMPVLSELGASPATTEKANPHYQQAARATLQLIEDPTLGPDIECLLVHLNNRQAQLEGLICAMLQRRDQWLGLTLDTPDAADLEQALEGAVTEHLAQLEELCRSDWLYALVQSAQQAATQLKSKKGDAAPLGDWLDRDTAPTADWADLSAWQGLAGLLLTKDGRIRKRWQVGDGFPAPTDKGLSAEQKQQRIAAKEAIQSLAAALADSPALALWQGLRLLPRQGLDEAQSAVLDSLFRVLLRAAVELKLVFQQAGEVDFAEIQMRAQRALGDPEHPTDLALALDYRLQHLLVDEFQDTSSSQYHLLATLTAGWQGDDGRTLFAVGDPMQSIYRFREADVGLYLAAREQGIGDLQLTPLKLEVNFRATGGLVSWVNRAFVSILPETVDVSRGAVPYSAAVAFDDSDDTQAVQVHPFAGLDKTAEATAVAGLVQQALGETDNGQIAVLARARSHLAEIALALNAAELPFQAVDIDPLAAQPVVRDLYALTRALLHPGDRLAWLTLLRAPWIGLDIDDLLQIAEPSPRTLWGRLCDPVVVQSLSEDGQARIERIRSVLASQLPARGRRPLRQWVERIWMLLGGLTATAEAQADAKAYLDLLDQQTQAAGIIDFGQLGAAIEKLYAAPDSRADGRVQLMTMHKSKGLEFDTVILPGLGRPTRGQDSELLYWLERTSRFGESQLLMAPIRAAGQAQEPISDYLRELDKDKEQLERARLLYVAATRAKRRLHLLGHIGFNDKGEPRSPVSNSLLSKLWRVVEPAFADLAAPPASPSTASTLTLQPLRRLPADWQAELPTSASDEATILDAVADTSVEFAWAGDTARHVGTLVHRQLERIARQGIDDWPSQRADELHASLRLGLSNLGVAQGELDAATAKAQRALRNTLDDERGRWMLSKHQDARCEWPLTHHGDEVRHYVIDRSFVDQDGVRWIIDYKTGEHLDGDRNAFLDRELERYRPQLETYGRIVSLLEPRPIRLVLYFPLFADWRVWDYAAE